MNQLALAPCPFDFDEDDGGLIDPVSPSLTIVGCVTVGYALTIASLHRRLSRSL